MTVNRPPVAIVTGGATGLGSAIAMSLARRGYNVAVNFSRSAEEAGKTAEECIAAGAPDAFAVQGDVGLDDDCTRIANAVVSRWGRIDTLVNNAGQTRKVPHADLHGLSGEDFLDVYRTNVIGAYQMIRACAPYMREAGGGSVVNISSGGAELGIGSSTAYAASKAALNTLSKSLARALAPEIRVNIVAPGFMATRWFSSDRTENEMQSLIEEQRAASPLNRIALPEDVAEAVTFLCTDSSSCVTGILLPVETGTLLGLAPRSLR